MAGARRHGQMSTMYSATVFVGTRRPRRLEFGHFGPRVAERRLILARRFIAGIRWRLPVRRRATAELVRRRSATRHIRYQRPWAKAPRLSSMFAPRTPPTKWPNHRRRSPVG